MEVYNFEQGAPEWFDVKRGVPSSSRFSHVLAGGAGKTRNGYLYELAEEILTGKSRKTYFDKNMKKGTELEPFARDEYEFVTGNDVEQVGFIKKDDVGCSPDGLINLDGGLEIKCPLPSTHIKIVTMGVVPMKYKPQIQGSLLVTGRKWWDFCSYCPEIDGKYIFIRRVLRDEDYILKLKDSLVTFLEELDDTVESMKE